MFMEKTEIIKNIALRSGGDIYLGVVGAVRTGKSTFIKRMVETLVVPYIEDEYEKKRTLDEIPQSAQGKTIMTTEPKFVPNEAIEITIGDSNTPFDAFSVEDASEDFDYLFIPVEYAGNSSLPVGDYDWNQNPGWRVTQLGGVWSNGAGAGAFCWHLNSSSGYRDRVIGGRLVYVPSKAAA